jgi:branched-chain amino acid transport system ATP-binding protein
VAPVLAVGELSVGYGGADVLHQVSLRVERDETVAVLGANGAGKTTLVNALAGVLPVSAGRVVFDGEDVTALVPERRARKGLSLVRQGRSVFPHMSVQENLDMGAYLVRDPALVRARLDAVFGMFPLLAERRRQLAGAMSGGEQKMLEIGRSLMLALKLLILDEPSLGLAPRTMETIFAKIPALNRAGTAVLLVEQNALAALAVSARAYVMELGRIHREDRSERLRGDPEVRERYLGV